jgi:predicted signal transduction protein with EAL and GGDEF domain
MSGVVCGTVEEFSAIEPSAKIKGKGLNSIPNRFGLMAFVLSTLLAVVLCIWMDKPLDLMTGSLAVGLIGLSVLANYFAARKLAGMIRSLRDSTHALVAGDFDSPVDVDCNCEVGGLADGFRAMVERLNSNIVRMNVLAYTDAVTGLPNRSVISHILGLAKQIAPADCTATMMFIDLDGFKRVNDTLGHDAGDELLRQAAHRIISQGLGLTHADLDQCTTTFGELCQTCPTRPVFARFAGDEFVLVLPGPQTRQQLEAIANRIRLSLSDGFTIFNSEVFVSASMGIARLPEDTTDPEQLLAYSDIAMYAAKEAGKNAFVFFDAGLKQKLVERNQIERELQRSLESGGFDLHFQPKFDAKTMAITGVEALARWNCPGIGPIAPDVFIRIAEQCGLMVAMGDAILRQAMLQARAWADGDMAMPVAVNVSPVQFEQADFVAQVEAILAETGLPADLLELEITETIAMTDFNRTRAQVDALRRLGVRISIDDFGNGYSNLSQLARLQHDTLKVDRSLVGSIGEPGRTDSMWLAIFNIATALGQKIVAEGVESLDQVAYLRKLGCHEFQGYLLAKPMSAAELEQWLEQRSRNPVHALGARLKTGLQMAG